MSRLFMTLFILMLSATLALLAYWAGVHSRWVVLSIFAVCYFVCDTAYRVAQ